MKVILSLVFFGVCSILTADNYPFFAIANGGIVQSDKGGIISLTDSLVTINANGSDKPVVFKVVSHSKDTFKYNGGYFIAAKEKGKVGMVGKSETKKYNTIVYMTMPNGIGGVLTLKYLCLID